MAGSTLGVEGQALVERLLDDLGKLMWAMVWDVANHNRWQLDPEEVHAELCLELVKVAIRYKSRPYHDIKCLAVTCMRNRVHDLATASYLTNRKAEARMLSLDAPADTPERGGDDAALEQVRSFDTGQGAERRGWLAANDPVFDLDDFCDGMSEDARLLVKEVLYPSERTGYFLWLAAQRKQTTSPKGFWTLTITPAIMARSMGWGMGRLKAAWGEVEMCVCGQVDFNGGLVAKEDGR